MNFRVSHSSPCSDESAIDSPPDPPLQPEPARNRASAGAKATGASPQAAGPGSATPVSSDAVASSAPSPLQKPRAGQHISYVTPLVESRVVDRKGHRGLFAIAPISAGTLLVAWGGEILPAADFSLVAGRRRQHSVQIDDELYLVPFGRHDPGAWINHSCNPNAGMCGQITLRALSDIHPGEEVTYDYAMSDGSPYDEFACGCGAENCRKRVSGNDWMREDLQHRYAGFFSPYLQRRIDAMHCKSPRSSTTPRRRRSPSTQS